MDLGSQERDRNPDVSKWRENRESNWYRDIGYQLQEVIRAHRYDIKAKGEKPDDPGWHECSCGEWAGYWSGFEPHVADHLRAALVDVVPRVSIEEKMDQPTTCKVWIGGQLKFDGVDKSVLLKRGEV